MIVFDAIICNTDRHYGNFGVMVSNMTNEIERPAPLFDHGNSLFNYAGRDDLENSDALSAYAGSLMPCLYDDFTGTAKKYLQPRHREGLRHLLEFRFRKNPRYNLDERRIAVIEQVIKRRAKALLDE